MKTKFLSDLIVKDIFGSRYVELYLPFSYYSEILDKIVVIPTGFICDYESVPLIRSTSKVGGVVHDYWCRKDSKPIVTKQQAADLYLEAQICRDNLLKENWFRRIDRAFRRQFKTLVVRVAPGYFHKFKVLASYEEIAG
jgi:hypothetical protein